MTETKRGGWIRVDPHDYDQPHEIGMGDMADVEVNIFISPFEIPRGVRGYYDQARRRFVIEFKYITREPSEVSAGGPPEVKAVVGKKTGRILGFEIDVDRLQATSVSLRLGAIDQIDQALEAVRSRSSLPRRENSRIASKVLHDRSEELFSAMAST